MLAKLDPHSAFMPPDVYKEVQVETKGEFGGVGIQIGIKDNRLTVIAPIDGTPAERAGIKAGDYIIKVNEESTKDMTLVDAVQKMRGPKGTKVTITIQREGAAEPMAFVLTREIIKIESVRSKMRGGRMRAAAPTGGAGRVNPGAATGEKGCDGDRPGAWAGAGPPLDQRKR